MPYVLKHQIVTFGTFEVDIDAEQVRKAGMRIRLSGQPFRLLLLLLADHGQIVPREKLQLEIWGENVNVDFERGIASAMNKLRETLGDAADHPLYIETVARKGFRFIAPVVIAPGVNAVEVVETDTSSLVEVHEAVAQTVELPLSTEVPLSPRVSGFRLRAAGISHLTPGVALAAAVGLVLASCLAAVLLHRGDVRPLPRIEQLTQTNDIYPGPPNAETILSIVTDGPRLYVPVLVEGQSRISALTVGGTFQQPVALPAALSTGAVTDLSADGSRLLIRSIANREPEQPLWVVPVTGGGARRVADVQAHDAAWVPTDPDRVVFATGTELRQVQLSTGAVSPLLQLEGRAFWLRWSHDARYLRFTLLNPIDHSTTLWEMDTASGKAAPLLIPALAGLDLCCGSWTPSGNAFIFQASSAGKSDLWSLRQGFHPVLAQLTNGPLRFSSPSVSRDGRAVFAFGGTAPESTMQFDPVGQALVRSAPYLQDAERVTTSDDGNWVAWTDRRGRLWRARAHGGEDLLQLTSDEMQVFNASWSPDGHDLVLMARQGREPWRLYQVASAGGPVSRLLSDSRNLADPTWGPEGRHIVFGREADLMGQESGPHEIAMLDVATRRIQVLPGSRDLFSPRWSPDGKWIAALSRDQSRLLLYDLQKQTWRTLYTAGAADPVWRLDSSAIVFHAIGEGRGAIVEAGVTGAIQTLADLNHLKTAASADYFFSGLAADGAPLVKPHIGTGNLYAIHLPDAR